MRTFIDSTPGSNLVGEEIKYGVTNSYIEVEFRIDDAFLVLYYIPRSSSSIFVATCWDHAFDGLLSNIDEDDWETIAETWPTLAKLLLNGANDRYSEGALIKLEDFDDGESKWYIASIAGNLDFDNIDDLLGDRTQKVSQLVILKSAELLTEMSENRPSIGRAIVKGITRGVGKGLLMAIGAAVGVDLSQS